jgi:hypothetical protein
VVEVNKVVSATCTKGDLDPERSGGVATSHWYKMAEAFIPIFSHREWVREYVG